MSKKKVAAAANEPIILEPRDVVFNFESAHKMNFLLQDAVEMHAFLWKMQEKAQPKKEEEIGPIVDRIFSLLKHGKEHELAGLKDVPQPFLRSTGRMLEKDGDAYKIITDAAAKMIISKKLMDEMKTAKDYDDEAFLDFKAMWKRKAIPANLVQQSPDIKDAVLLKCQDAALGEKLYENQLGNRILFGCASHKVTASSNSSSQRVKIALEILKGLDESDIVSDNKDAPKYSRFMVRSAGDEDANINWSILSLVEAAEFIQTFVFEVFLEKEIHVSGGAADNQDPVASDGPGVVPIKEPTEYDVLFGRGGMTNGHTGNRRFRDIIALHRPDYIRAIKMDKPAVARKIVKAIRCGNPPGRFLKKGDDGLYYDVGNRTAAEKTSQGLRERSNAEKRQRSELRRALRIRREDLEESDDSQTSTKKAKSSNSGGDPAEGEKVAPALMQLNYVGTNLSVPLSLTMTQQVVTNATIKKARGKGKPGYSELNTEGLPPNAVDQHGNVLVTDYDILCGRGGLTNHHKGNKRFRDIVALHRPDYVRAPKIQKPSVARVIVRAIRNGDPPGRFLRKHEASGKWVDIGDKKAAEKTSQALREKSGDDDGERPLGNLGILLPSPASYLPLTHSQTANVMGNILAAGTGPLIMSPTATVDMGALSQFKNDEDAAEVDQDLTATAHVVALSEVKEETSEVDMLAEESDAKPAAKRSRRGEATIEV